MPEETVSLVIPGRNCAKTIRHCLDAVVPLKETSSLSEIIFVDDGSTDETAAIVGKYPVVLLSGTGRGPGAARNVGWRAARCPLVWFVDADCVAEPDALDKLIAQIGAPRVGGVSGSYGIMNPESLLPRLIHEEIVERHRAMSHSVDFLATFNVLYKRAVLDEVGGFDETYLKGQDAELSFRVLAAGYELRFTPDARVKHFHPTSLRKYLTTQRRQGYWRVPLHLMHHGHTLGDSYSGFSDHVQPPLALLTLLTVPLAALPHYRWIPVIKLSLLALAQIPMTFRLVRRTHRLQYFSFSLLSMVRAFWRGIGMAHGAVDYLRGRFVQEKAQTA